MASLSQVVPTFVIHAHVAVDVRLRCLHGNVHGLKRHVGEERFTVAEIAANELDGFVDQEARGVEVVRQLEALAIRNPVCPIVDRQVRPLLPIVSA